MPVSSLLTFLSADPALRLMQGLLLALAVLVVYLVFFTLRDVLLRSRNFAFQLFSILLVAFVPVVGFLLYMLIRPVQTLAERRRDRWLRDLHAVLPATEVVVVKEEKKDKDTSKKDKDSKPHKVTTRAA